MNSTIHVHMAKGKPQSSPVVAIWSSRGPRCIVVVPHRLQTGSTCRARRTRTGSHNDGNDAAPTRSQTQHRWSGAPHADGKGQRSSQGALR